MSNLMLFKERDCNRLAYLCLFAFLGGVAEQILCEVLFGLEGLRLVRLGECLRKHE